MAFGKEISIQNLTKDDLQGYAYALIYRSEGIELLEKSAADAEALLDAESYTMDSNLEARFFGASGELHLFSDDGSVKAVLTEFDNAQYVDELYRIDAQFTTDQVGKLIVRKLLDYDEDGQAYVKQTCLAGVEA